MNHSSDQRNHLKRTLHRKRVH